MSADGLLRADGKGHPPAAEPRRIGVALAGASGRVGRAFAALLAAREEALRARGLELPLVGVARARGWSWDPAGFAHAAPHGWFAGAVAGALAGFLERARAHEGPLVLVDCTASEDVAAASAALLADGIAVVTANKLGSAGTLARWRELHAGRGGGVSSGASGAVQRAPYRHSATVGAGLPVLAAVRRLTRRGERVRALRAVLSGSLSAVLSAVQDGVAFSDAVADARARGCTEPHPGEDLSGEDVARKLLIVLREAGLPIERAQLRVEPLVPAGLLRERDPEAFLRALPEFDDAWRSRAGDAARAGRRLAFVAEYDGAIARAGVRALPSADTLATLRAGENRVELTTDVHDAVPLAISGPGAGPEVTAANVLSDLLDVARGAWGARYDAESVASRAASA